MKGWLSVAAHRRRFESAENQERKVLDLPGSREKKLEKLVQSFIFLPIELQGIKGNHNFDTA
jgi:hypothetical protein